MGYRHSRQALLDGAVTLAMGEGLANLSFGRVASSLGVSDRMVVYYFPSKGDLVTAVLAQVTAALQSRLRAGVSAPMAAYDELALHLWRPLTKGAADAATNVYLEASGLAAYGREPYASALSEVAASWVAWAADLLVAPSEEARRCQAAAALALVDGLLLLRATAGAEAAEDAATAIGGRVRAASSQEPRSANVT